MLHSLVILLLAFSALSASPAKAKDLDNFTFRYDPIEDSLPILNAEVNRRLDKAVRKSNQRRPGCDPHHLLSMVHDQFVFPSISHFENFATHAPGIDRRPSPHRDGVFKYFSPFSQSPNFIKAFPLAPILNVNGDRIGADKFSHFFNVGWRYYRRAYQRNKGIDAALSYGKALERGILGEVTVGSYSYGDLISNFNGMLFFRRLLGGDAPDDPTPPFIRCDQGQWKRVRDMDWREYMDAGADEGINCSSFVSPVLQKAFDRRIKELEAETGNRMTCPVAPVRCAELVMKYGVYASQLLHPLCLAYAPTPP